MQLTVKDEENQNLSPKIVHTPLVFRGYIRDAYQRPIPSATIKALDEKDNPLCHSLSQKDGSFFLLVSEENPRHLVLSAPQYLTEEVPLFTEITSFILKSSDNACLVTGRVLDKNSPPVEVLELSLTDGKNTVLSYSDEKGSFHFPPLPPTIYKLYVRGNSYREKCFTVQIPQGIKEYHLGDLPIEKQEIFCTIHGFVREENGVCIPHALVLLWGENRKSLVSHTWTNERGLYFFGGLSKGNYEVEAFC